jgi:RHS repeat-associated protein
MVIRTRPQPATDVQLTYVKQGAEPNGDAGDKYTGLNRFGWIVDQRWIQGAATLDRIQYGYDRDGNRLYADNLLDNNFDELYHADGATAGYDTLNRLVEWQRGPLSDTNADLIPDTVVTASRSQVFTLDAQGNFDSVDTDGTPTARTHNAQNEIQTVGAANLTYDNNGNLTTDELGQTLEFDAWNRLVRVKTSGGATIISYEVDALGRRIEEVTASVRDLYYSMNWQVLEERVAGVARVRNVWSVGYVDAMLLRDRDADNNGSLEQRHYVQQDANWNVTSITSNTGAVQERYVYDVYGSRTVLSPTWVTLGGSAYAWNIGHQGGRFEILTGLIHKRGREYSPALQTFVQRDLIFTSTNWYVAFGNNPVNYVDPSGLMGEPHEHHLFARKFRAEFANAFGTSIDIDDFVLPGVPKSGPGTVHEKVTPALKTRLLNVGYTLDEIAAMNSRGGEWNASWGELFNSAGYKNTSPTGKKAAILRRSLELMNQYDLDPSTFQTWRKKTNPAAFYKFLEILEKAGMTIDPKQHPTLANRLKGYVQCLVTKNSSGKAEINAVLFQQRFGTSANPATFMKTVGKVLTVAGLASALLEFSANVNAKGYDGALAEAALTVGAPVVSTGLRQTEQMTGRPLVPNKGQSWSDSAVPGAYADTFSIFSVFNRLAERLGNLGR